jgi:flavin-dependent dehydrogenase
MTQSTKVDVAIIGAGPVGMTLACELIRHGLSVHIVDKAPSTKDYGRAPVFWPAGTIEADLGDSAHPTPMMVGQDVTEKILDEYLRGIGAPVALSRRPGRNSSTTARGSL